MKTPTIPDDALLTERRSRYARHLPVFPQRRTRVPSLLAGRGEFQALAAERAALQAAEARLSGEHQDWQQRVRLATAEHREAQRRAMLDGGPPPPPLATEPWPYPDHTRSLFDQIHIVIEATELGLLEENAVEYAALLDAEVQPTRATLEDARRQVNRLEADLVRYDRTRETLEELASCNLPRAGHDQPPVVHTPRPSKDPDSSPASEADLFEALHPRRPGTGRR